MPKSALRLAAVATAAVAAAAAAAAVSLAALFAASGCATVRVTGGEPWSSNGRPASGTPETFTPADPAGKPLPDACLTRLVDPRDGTRLDLQQSMTQNGVTKGDYAVSPPDCYGVGARELLRVDCGSLRAIGIVRRGD